MSKNVKTPVVKQISIDKINILNPRVRNRRIFKEIATNIAQVGLKRPITVTRCHSGAPGKDYDLVCGQGRMEAFMACGQTKIPAIVIDVDEEQALIMSLVENLARRQHSSLELLDGIELLRKKGYDTHAIAAKIGVSDGYVSEILKLMEKGEERLINAVETGQLPLSLAITVVNSPEDEQKALGEAFNSGELKGTKYLLAKRQLALRRRHGKLLHNGKNKNGKKKPVTKRDVIQILQKEIDRKQMMSQKAEVVSNCLSFVVTALKQLLQEDHFSTLLRAEKIDDMPARLYELLGMKTP